MQKAQLVKKVLGDRFAKHGFDYMGSVDRGNWEFKKTLETGIELMWSACQDIF